MVKVRWYLKLAFFSSISFLGHSLDLTLTEEDVYLEPRFDGLHLFVRQKGDIQSILIVESAEPQEKYAPTYSFRSFIPFFGDREYRLLGEKLVSNADYHFLTATEVEYSPQLGEMSFHTVIPPKIFYGFPGMRYQEVDLTVLFHQENRPLWISIRSFTLPYNSYTGSYQDNPFEIFLPIQEALPSSGSLIEFSQSQPAQVTGLQAGTFYELQQDQLFPSIAQHIHSPISLNTEKEAFYAVDIALVIDVTKSMQPYVHFLRKELVSFLEVQQQRFSSLRVGIVLYKDYHEDFLVVTYPFSFDLSATQAILNELTVGGGGDIPEAMLEGIYTAATQLQWKAPRRHILVVADAPGHPTPRGKITPQLVSTQLNNLALDIAVYQLSR